MKKYGFIRVGNIVNNLKVGDPIFNREELVKLIKEAYKKLLLKFIWFKFKIKTSIFTSL